MENFPEFYMSSEFDNLKNKWKLIKFLENETVGDMNRNINSSTSKENYNDFPISKLKLMLVGKE